MTTSSRSEKIRSILEARRPMAEKVRTADEALNQLETQIREFKRFIPSYASRLDSEAASAVSALLPDTDQLLAEIALEKSKLALLAGRYSRPTLNIGVVGQARQGKSQLLQTVTGLSPNEIPSGDRGHCTGAPSIIVNQEGNTFANLTFHSESSFIHNVIQPFFSRLNLIAAPSTIDGLRAATIPMVGSEDAKKYGATETEHLKKLIAFQVNIDSYKDLLGSPKRRIEKGEIRDYVAQENLASEPIHKWIAVQLAEIYCEFPHTDVGNIALADTPGLGDFQSGAEQRLAATIGTRLDSALMLRLPPSVGAVVGPSDTGLHDLIQQAVPDLTAHDWSHFIINTYPSKSPDVSFFESELRRSSIRTRGIHKVDVGSTEEVATFLNHLLNDIAGTLQGLDLQLFEKQVQSLKILTSAIGSFASKAESVLPKAVLAQPDLALLNHLFGEVWMNLGEELKKLVDSYRSRRDEPDQDFLDALKTVFSALDQGPIIPEVDAIDREAATEGLMRWQADKLHDLRVQVANSFESIDSCLHSSFEQLRGEFLDALRSESGGRLAKLDISDGTATWNLLLERWNGHEGGEVMRHAIELLMSAGLSFRGFIQPRIRHCLDVLDSASPEAKVFCYVPGDTPALVKEKLELAWESAGYKCKTAIEGMAKEPAMARFAAAEDFRESILRTGGVARARETWHLFYHENRAEIWRDQFSQLEANTRLRKEWENAVSALKESSANVAKNI